MKVVVGLGNPGSPVRGDAPQRRLAGHGPLAERAGWDGRGPPARRLQRRRRPLPRPRPDARQAADLHERLRPGRAQGAAREHAPLADLLVVADDFALPFGKLRFREGGGPRRPQRPAVDRRRARHGEVQPAPRRDRRARPERDATTSCRGSRPTSTQRLDELLDAAADAVEAWAREGTSKAANRFNKFELRPPTRTGSPRPARSTARPAPTASAARRPAGARIRPPEDGRRRG